MALRGIVIAVVLQAVLLAGALAQQLDSSGTGPSVGSCVLGLDSVEFQLNSRWYYFKGSCLVTQPDKDPYRTELRADGWYSPETGTASEELWLSFMGMTNRSIATFASDPWLDPAGAGPPTNPSVSMTGGTIEIWTNGEIHPWSSTEILDEAKRHELMKQAVPAPPPPCLGSGIGPILRIPSEGVVFPAGTREVPIIATFPCRFEDYRDALLMFETEVTLTDPADGSTHTFTDTKGTIDLYPPSNPSERYKIVSYGTGTIPIDYDGFCRIRAKAQWFDNDGPKTSNWSTWRTFWIGRQFLSADAMEQFVRMNAPDLVIAGGQRELRKAGETDPKGNPLSEDAWFYRWTIECQGKQGAVPATDLRVECFKRGPAAECPTGGLVGTFRVDPVICGMSRDVFTGGIPVPTTRVNWQLKATADAAGEVVEHDEGNNQFNVAVKWFPMEKFVGALRDLPDKGNDSQEGGGLEAGLHLVTPTPTPTTASSQLGALGAKLRLPDPGSTPTHTPSPTPTRTPTPKGTSWSQTVPAGLAIGRVYASPTIPRAGEPFDIWVEFLNKGSEAVGKDQPWIVDCMSTPSGAPCPVKEEKRTIGQSIPAGGNLLVRLPVASAAGGSYRIKFTLGPSAVVEGVILDLAVLALPPGGMIRPPTPTPTPLRINPGVLR